MVALPLPLVATSSKSWRSRSRLVLTFSMPETLSRAQRWVFFPKGSELEYTMQWCALFRLRRTGVFRRQLPSPFRRKCGVPELGPPHGSLWQVAICASARDSHSQELSTILDCSSTEFCRQFSVVWHRYACRKRARNKRIPRIFVKSFQLSIWERLIFPWRVTETLAILTRFLERRLVFLFLSAYLPAFNTCQRW